MFVAPDPSGLADSEGYFEVRPIGTPLGMRELAALHKRAWGGIGILEKRVLMILWPLALHFGLYWIERGAEEQAAPNRWRILGALARRSTLDFGPSLPDHPFQRIIRQ